MERNQWSIEVQNANVHRFITDHGIKVHDIRVQPWLGDDITWKKTPDGWEILLYPSLYRGGPSEETILHALSAINRWSNPWFEETPGEEFNSLTKELLDTRRTLNPSDRELYASIIVAIDQALCTALDLYYLETRGYLNLQELRRLANWRSMYFAAPEIVVQFLGAVSVIKVLGANLSEFHETLIENKWYGFFPVIDRIENCVRNSRVVHEDSIMVFDTLLPHLKEKAFLDTIAVLRRNALGPRDDAEIDYDVAISYAGEDRQMAEPIADALVRERIVVFYDRYVESELWGKELYAHLTDVYKRRAKVCVMFISAHYAGKLWPTVEREAAVARAVDENSKYILPLRVDDTVVPGLPPSIVHVDLRSKTVEQVHQMIIERVRLVG